MWELFQRCGSGRQVFNSGAAISTEVLRHITGDALQLLVDQTPNSVLESARRDPAQKAGDGEQDTSDGETGGGHGIRHRCGANGAEDSDDAQNHQCQTDSVQGLELLIFSNSSVHNFSPFIFRQYGYPRLSLIASTTASYGSLHILPAYSPVSSIHSARNGYLRAFLMKPTSRKSWFCVFPFRENTSR